MKATGMYAIAWMAAFVFLGGTSCAPPHSASLRGGGNVYAADNDYRQARDMVILHRWGEEEASGSGMPFEQSAESNEDDYYGPNRSADDGPDAFARNHIKKPAARKEEATASPVRPKNTSAKKNLAAPPKAATAGNKIISYTVKKNDTLFSLAKRYGCTTEDIIKLNGLGKRGTIKVGAKLKIPSSRGNNPAGRGTAISRPATIKNIGFRWPLPGVVSVKRESAEGVKPHGVEIIGRPGATVLSAAPGVVKRVGDMRGYGRYVIISHDNRFVTVYSRMGEIEVKEGERVSSGAVIGKIDAASRSMHFQIGCGGKPVDPLKFLPQRS